MREVNAIASEREKQENMAERRTKKNNNKTSFITLRGETSFAKVLGKPQWGYKNRYKEWTLDLVLTDPADEERLRKLGLGKRIKRKDTYLDGKPHITLRQKEERSDGTLNDPPEVVDVTGEPWDNRKMIGNKSVVDVKLRVVDYGADVEKGVYIQGIRVLKLVKYSRPLFDDLDEDDEYYNASMDDDVESEDYAESDEREEEEDEAPRRPARKSSSKPRSKPVEYDYDEDEEDNDPID